MKIRPLKARTAEITVPGSKSYSHRILIAAALSNGTCRIENCLMSEDTRFTIAALKQLGVPIQEKAEHITVHGCAGDFKACERPIFLGNSGTSMRLLTALAGLGKGTVTIQGTERMHERPIEDLLDGLVQLGISAKSLNKNGCPPVEVTGGMAKGGPIKLRCGKSSQFLSAILLIAPYLQNGVDIHIVEGPVSRPYIDMTLAVMDQFGVHAERQGYQHFKVGMTKPYQSGSYKVECDASQAGYFWASAAITGSSIKVMDIDHNSLQGDIRFVSLLESMGCQSVQEKDGIRVKGGALAAIHADMADIPDMVPTLAVVAAFAKGTTVIQNVAHLKEKESNRLAAVVQELNRMGIKASCTEDGMVITGGTPHGTAIETYNDHRIAMSFAMAGLVAPGIDIQNPVCVEKSFPNFWEVFGALCE
jgi:3-phosphoshikimate 1-carboxyvinyltransferase